MRILNQNYVMTRKKIGMYVVSIAELQNVSRPAVVKQGRVFIDVKTNNRYHENTRLENTHYNADFDDDMNKVVGSFDWLVSA